MRRIVVMLLATVALAAVVMLSVAAMSREGAGRAAVKPKSGDAGPAATSSSLTEPATSPLAASAPSAGVGATQPTTTAAVGTMPAGGPATRMAAAVSASSRPGPGARAVGPGGPGAATQAAPSTVVLPPEFAILQARSPFGRGPKKPSQPASTAAGPEASFVLKGAVDVGGQLTAFVEDLSAKKVVQLTSGQPIARGRVKAITLDSMEYEAAPGSAKRIEVGQNLNGQVVPPTPTSKPASAPGQPGQPGQPGAPGGPGQPGMPPGAVPGRPMPQGQPVPAPSK